MNKYNLGVLKKDYEVLKDSDIDTNIWTYNYLKTNSIIDKGINNIFDITKIILYDNLLDDIEFEYNICDDELNYIINNRVKEFENYKCDKYDYTKTFHKSKIYDIIDYLLLFYNSDYNKKHENIIKYYSLYNYINKFKILYDPYKPTLIQEIMKVNEYDDLHTFVLISYFNDNDERVVTDMLRIR